MIFLQSTLDTIQRTFITLDPDQKNFVAQFWTTNQCLGRASCHGRVPCAGEWRRLTRARTRRARRRRGRSAASARAARRPAAPWAAAAATAAPSTGTCGSSWRGSAQPPPGAPLRSCAHLHELWKDQQLKRTWVDCGFRQASLFPGLGQVARPQGALSPNTRGMGKAGLRFPDPFQWFFRFLKNEARRKQTFDGEALSDDGFCGDLDDGVRVDEPDEEVESPGAEQRHALPHHARRAAHLHHHVERVLRRGLRAVRRSCKQEELWSFCFTSLAAIYACKLSSGHRTHHFDNWSRAPECGNYFGVQKSWVLEALWKAAGLLHACMPHPWSFVQLPWSRLIFYLLSELLVHVLWQQQEAENSFCQRLYRACFHLREENSKIKNSADNHSATRNFREQTKCYLHLDSTNWKK